MSCDLEGELGGILEPEAEPEHCATQTMWDYMTGNDGDGWGMGLAVDKACVRVLAVNSFGITPSNPFQFQGNFNYTQGQRCRGTEGWQPRATEDTGGGPIQQQWVTDRKRDVAWGSKTISWFSKLHIPDHNNSVGTAKQIEFVGDKEDTSFA